MEEAGVPAGVVNLVLGPGDSVGAELSANNDVDLISFTGGIETGKRIMQAASSNVKIWHWNLAVKIRILSLPMLILKQLSTRR